MFVWSGHLPATSQSPAEVDAIYEELALGRELGALQELPGKQRPENPLVVLGAVEIAITNAYCRLFGQLQLAADAVQVLLLFLFLS